MGLGIMWEEFKNCKLGYGDCLKLMKDISDASIDLTVTSPPYDNLRTYNDTLEWGDHVWKPVLEQLFRVTKLGGVVVWIVNDATIKGSETGTSFRQALYAKEIGFSLHDTMIYKKINYTPLTHNRYEQEWEYMFCFSKNKPKTFNPVKIQCKYANQNSWGKRSYVKKSDGKLIESKKRIINEYKIKGNIFEYRVGSIKSKGIKHPAIFPLELCIDQINSWSNENDVILDPFMGSGTTGVACVNLKRQFIGVEKDEHYYNLTKGRINDIFS